MRILRFVPRSIAALVLFLCVGSGAARAADEQPAAPTSELGAPAVGNPAPGAPPSSAVPKAVPPPKASGLEFRVGFGPALPSGAASGASGDSMSNYFGTLWMVDLDLGYRFDTNWYLGVYVSGTPWDSAVGDSLRSPCAASGTSCSTRDGRFGFMGAYHFNPAGPTDFWLGFGLAYEVATFQVGNSQSTLSGAELRSILGVDFDSFGLFLDLPFGVYQTAASGGSSQSISQTGTHSWPRLGVEYRLF